MCWRKRISPVRLRTTPRTTWCQPPAGRCGLGAVWPTEPGVPTKFEEDIWTLCDTSEYEPHRFTIADSFA